MEVSSLLRKVIQSFWELGPSGRSRWAPAFRVHTCKPVSCCGHRGGSPLSPNTAGHPRTHTRSLDTGKEGSRVGKSQTQDAECMADRKSNREASEDGFPSAPSVVGTGTRNGQMEEASPGGAAVTYF